MKKAVFKLTCMLCGNKEERPIEECKGSDNPLCSKCGGPMLAEAVITR